MSIFYQCAYDIDCYPGFSCTGYRLDNSTSFVFFPGDDGVSLPTPKLFTESRNWRAPIGCQAPESVFLSFLVLDQLHVQLPEPLDQEPT